MVLGHDVHVLPMLNFEGAGATRYCTVGESCQGMGRFWFNHSACYFLRAFSCTKRGHGIRRSWRSCFTVKYCSVLCRVYTVHIVLHPQSTVQYNILYCTVQDTNRKKCLAFLADCTFTCFFKAKRIITYPIIVNDGVEKQILFFGPSNWFNIIKPCGVHHCITCGWCPTWDLWECIRLDARPPGIYFLMHFKYYLVKTMGTLTCSRTIRQGTV